MFKLIIFHHGIGIKQKLYLIYKYCFCFYYHFLMYFIITYKRNRHLKKTWGGKGGKCALRDFNLVYKDIKKMIKPSRLAKKKLKLYGIMFKKNDIEKSSLYINANEEMAKKWSKKNLEPKKIYGFEKIKEKIIKDIENDKIVQKEKDKLYQHVIDYPLGIKQANEILKIAGMLSRKGIYLNELFEKPGSYLFRIAKFHYIYEADKTNEFE